jgi:hypothetical protein
VQQHQQLINLSSGPLGFDRARQRQYHSTADNNVPGSFLWNLFFCSVLWLQPLVFVSAQQFFSGRGRTAGWLFAAAA